MNAIEVEVVCDGCDAEFDTTIELGSDTQETTELVPCPHCGFEQLVFVTIYDPMGEEESAWERATGR